MIKFNIRLILRNPLNTTSGITLFSSLYLTLGFLNGLYQTDPSSIYSLIVLSSLMAASTILDQEYATGIVRILYTEQKLFIYCIIKILFQSLALGTGIAALAALSLSTLTLTVFLPVIVVLLSATLVNLITGFHGYHQLLSMTLLLPLLIPVFIASCLLTTHTSQAIYFLCGWGLIQIVSLYFCCFKYLQGIINLS